MANTRDDVLIASQTWTDLYAATGIVVGTAVNVYNKGSNACLLCIKATSPDTDTQIGAPLYAGSVGSFANISAGESGLWVYCDAAAGTRILVQEA
jgi:hypothetical protein